MAFFDTTQLLYVLRMVIAGLCGCIIGLERKNRSKEAGIRTHFVVACASALIMIISKYGFADTTAGINGMRGADGARIAAQAISGIGFLGAGTIFVHKNTVTGLTTAAGIWATAAVGLAIGGGMYIVGIAAMVLIVLAQVLLHKNFSWLKMPKSKKLTIKGVDVPGYQTYITKLLEDRGITVYDVSMEKGSGVSNYTFILEVPRTVQEEEILSCIDFQCSISINS